MLGVTEADYVVVLVKIRASYIKSDLFALNTFLHLFAHIAWASATGDLCLTVIGISSIAGLVHDHDQERMSSFSFVMILMLYNYSCDQGSFSSDMSNVLFQKIRSKTSQSFQFLLILREETSGMRCVSQWHMLSNVLHYRCYITDQ